MKSVTFQRCENIGGVKFSVFKSVKEQKLVEYMSHIVKLFGVLLASKEQACGVRSTSSSDMCSQRVWLLGK